MADTEAALATLNQAINWVEREHRTLSDEVTAMKSFDTHLETIEPEAVCRLSSKSEAIRALSPAESVSDQLATVKQAYQETVMTVDHYDEDYGESFEQHVYHEFGPDMSKALIYSSWLSPPIYRQLRTDVADAIESRKQVLELLAAERDGLRDVRTVLASAHERIDNIASCVFRERTTPALHKKYDQIQTLRGRCEQFATERQSTRREYVEAWSALPGRATTEEYLYEPLDTTYPGLAALAVFADRLRETAQELSIVLLDRDSSPEDRDERRSSLPSVDNPI